MKNYKTILVLLCGMLLLQSCKQKVNKKVTGCTFNLKLLDGQSGKVVVYPYQLVKTMEESKRLTIEKEVDITNNTFNLDTVQVLRNFNISLNDKRFSAEIFTGPGTYNLSFGDDKLVVEGSNLHKEFQKLDEVLGYSKMKTIQYKKDLSKDEAEFKSNYGVNLLAAIKENSKSQSLAAIVYKFYWAADLPTLNTILTSFDTSIHNNFYLKQLIKRKDNLEKVAVGQEAPIFTLNSFENKKVSLKSYRGSFLLIDFWAYWCGPCIAGFPELKEIRAEYDEDELSILSVSTDINKDKWVEAVKKHQLPWTQLIDDETNVSDTYAITAIPHLILISPEGEIVYKHHYSNNLTEELKKFLK
ncbi:TlpA disulfide reductase family protein [uncultured Lutibacter sp.]|uniref:TlpA family protein disulfide reductase n=1 Tax=uncultured Lutibacter sp. TaxID=437739 RepID=UPI002633D3CC|nr:TlpA disulfide reductase family protein [uncultured Lutibacter sp.]